MWLGALAILLAVFTSHARAEESFNNDDWRGDAPDARPVIDESGPIYSANDHWVGTALVVILGLGLIAAVAGPMVRTKVPELATITEKDSSEDQRK